MIRAVPEPSGHTVVALPGAAAFSAATLSKLVTALRRDFDVDGVYAEHLHVLSLSRDLTAERRDIAEALLRYGPSRGQAQLVGRHFCTVGPRPGTISPWSSKATDIFQRCGLDEVIRVERMVRWYVDGTADEAVAGHLHDRMTEALFGDDDFARVFQARSPQPLDRVPFLNGGPEALAAANSALGLALSDDEIDYLALQYRELERDPTDVELMMFAQANSEHCRHKIFNASWSIDGAAQSESLFGMIRNTYRSINGAGILSAYSDNAAVIEGAHGERFFADPHDAVYRAVAEAVHVLMKVETHNHPTAIAPYPGAATGSGGEIRDEGAVGRGSKPKAGLAGFTTSHLKVPGYPRPWEIDVGKPERIVSALEIMLDGPIGAAGFNNEYGRPALGGYFRTFEAPADAELGQFWGYHKPVMIAGGVGSIRAEHVNASDVPAGARLVVLGGPAMLIGLGGGAASSMASGDSHSDLDFASVQRDNAEMERRCQEVIDRCWALGDGNPIRLIHDVGAGGLSNALPELVADAGRGGRFDLRAVPNADRGMSPMEIWCNEAQERYVLAVAAEDLAAFEAICRRERCPYAVVGTATADSHLVVEDPEFGNRPVDLSLATLLGKPPKMHRQFARAERSSETLDLDGVDVAAAAKRVLSFPAVASKSFLITIGDRSITGLVARDQMVGPWQVPVADVAVTLADFTGFRGEAMAMGERAPVAVVNPAASARMAVAEALTNLFAADVEALGRVVLSANWMAAAGYGQEDQALFDAVQAVGMELCPALGIAVPVGKDSLSMRTAWQTESGAERSVASPVTLNVTAFAPVADARRTLTPVMQGGETTLLLLETRPADAGRLGGSALAQTYGQLGAETPDVDDPLLLKALLELVLELNRAGLLLASHDRSDGGLFTTLVEMAFASRLGVEIALAGGDPLVELFAEEVGVVVEVADIDVATVAARAEQVGVRFRAVAKPTPVEAGEAVVVSGADGAELLRTDRAALQREWAELSHRMQALRDDPAAADEEHAAIVGGEESKMTPRLSFDPAVDVSAAFASTSRPRVAVLREQGVNGQVEMAAAFDRAGFDAVDVHMSDLFEGRADLAEFSVLAACGGFSYGDVLGGGGGWAKSILFDARVRDMFQTFLERDTLTLGICNGCQMLSQLKSLVPGAESWPTFVRNRSEQFEGRSVVVRIAAEASPWLDGMAGSCLPVAVAHGEGRAEYDADDTSRHALHYVDGRGEATERYPLNPNGSPGGIAGVLSASGRALIMMPHPERVFRTVQNSWAPSEWGEDGPWLRLFRNGRVALS